MSNLKTKQVNAIDKAVAKIKKRRDKIMDTILYTCIVVSSVALVVCNILSYLRII